MKKMEILRMKKCITRIIILLLFVLSMLIMTLILKLMWEKMQKDTDSILVEVENAIFCSDYYVSEEEYQTDMFQDEAKENPEIHIISVPKSEYSTNIYANLNLLNRCHVFNIDQFNIQLSVKRNYAMHNFKSGYIWIEYSLSVKPKNTAYCERPDLNYGGNFHMKLKIEKESENWVIKEIWAPDHWCSKEMEYEYWYTTSMSYD